MKVDTPVPEWINELSRKCVSVLGLEHWAVTLMLEDIIDTDRGTLGQARINYRYYSAEISLKSNIENNADGRDTVVHEHVHLALMGIAQAVDSLLQLIPPKLRTMALGIYTDGDEQTVTLLTRHLTPLILACVPHEPATTPAPMGNAPDKGTDLILAGDWTT